MLLFSLGYTAIGSSYTALLEDLASYGYAVLSVIHPYESMAATLADGRVVTMLDAQKQLRKGIRDVFDEWAKEGDTMATVTRARDEAEALTVMRGYLGTLPITTAVVTRWVEDTAFVLDRLPRLPPGPAARLAARLDLGHLGAFGHSMGGVASADFCARDRRCRAALNLDGIPQYGSLIDTPFGRPFLMVYSAREGRLGASDVDLPSCREAVPARGRRRYPAQRFLRHGALGRPARRTPHFRKAPRDSGGRRDATDRARVLRSGTERPPLAAAVGPDDGRGRPRALTSRRFAPGTVESANGCTLHDAS